ncbi:MAG: FecR domain-containing protein [Candidatus Hydrogenedentes bacterium]|nr:FecR domain-containing protein [Candidatus Hydrogenedentota bacterium]
MGRPSLLYSFVVFTFLTPTLFAADESPFHARVSFDPGSLMVMGSEESEWSHATTNSVVLPGDTLWVEQEGIAELEVAGGTFVALADASKTEIVSLTPGAEFKVWLGSVYVQRVARSTGDLAVVTPACTVRIPDASIVRVDVEESGSTVVSVHAGNAEISTEAGGTLSLAARQRVYIDAGLLPSEIVAIDPAAADEFDEWARKRNEELSGGGVPEQTEIPASTIGASTLSRYGEWVTIDNTPSWRPTFVADYVPYRHGCWSYVPRYGYVWDEWYPFGYVTTHHGRWTYVSRYGWVWRYDPVWRPCYAVTMRYGDYFVWAPLGWDDRPVIVEPGLHFSIGGINFGMHATSYVPIRHVLDGYAYVQPFQRETFQVIQTTNVNVWNINVGDRSNFDLPYLKSIKSTHFEPPRKARGPLVWGRDGAEAPTLVRALESKLARADFRPQGKSVEKRPTAPKTGPEGSRKVRVKAEARETEAAQVRKGAPVQQAAVRGAKPRETAPEMKSRPQERTVTPAEKERGGPAGAPAARVKEPGPAPEKTAPAAKERPEKAAPAPKERAETAPQRPETKGPEKEKRSIQTRGPQTAPEKKGVPKTEPKARKTEPGPKTAQQTRRAPSLSSSPKETRPAPKATPKVETPSVKAPSMKTPVESPKRHAPVTVERKGGGKSQTPAPPPRATEGTGPGGGGQKGRPAGGPSGAGGKGKEQQGGGKR